MFHNFGDVYLGIDAQRERWVWEKVLERRWVLLKIPRCDIDGVGDDDDDVYYYICRDSKARRGDGEYVRLDEEAG